MTVEQLAQKIFDECAKDGEPVTEEEAREMAEMELGAKSITRYEMAESRPQCSTKARSPQVSAEKIELFDLIWEGIYNFYGTSAQIKKNNKEISVEINGKTFKIDLIERRKGA